MSQRVLGYYVTSGMTKKGDILELLSIRDCTKEDASWLQVLRCIFEHHPDLLLRLKSVVHTELHRRQVKGFCFQSMYGKAGRDGFLNAYQRSMKRNGKEEKFSL